MKQLQQEFAEAMPLVEKSAGSDGIGLRVCRLSMYGFSQVGTAVAERPGTIWRNAGDFESQQT